MAACLWIGGAGGPPSTVMVKLFADGSVNLNMGASDIGTGTKSVMAMVVAEELGVDPGAIQIENADTATTQFATPSGGSKTVPTESPAVRGAALAVKRQAPPPGRRSNWACRGGDLELRDGAHRRRPADRSKTVRVTEVDGLQRQGVLVGVGYREPNPEGKAVNPFAAQFCEVEVDTRTGEVRILRFLGAHDSGRVLNRLTFDNQVFGGITMGIGLGATERRILDRGQTGKMVNANWHDYKLPTMLDVPPSMTSVPIDLPDPEANVTGAKGLGEPVTIPTAAAFANAVYHATGVRVTESPIDPPCAELPARRAGEGGCDVMTMPSFKYVRPGSVDEAVRLAAADGARLHAGGTDLLGCLHDGVFGADTRGQPDRLREPPRRARDGGRRAGDRRADHGLRGGRPPVDPRALRGPGPGGVRGGEPPAPPPGHPRRQSLPEAAVLVLPERGLPLPPEGRRHVLRRRRREPVPRARSAAPGCATSSIRRTRRRPWSPSRPPSGWPDPGDSGRSRSRSSTSPRRSTRPGRPCSTRARW